MKNLFFGLISLIVYFTGVSSAFATESSQRDYQHLFFTIVNSGSGGAILGHTYLTFCPDMLKFNLRECMAVEYNLDVNIGEKFEKLKESGLREKINMFNDANYRIYKYENAHEFSMKYINRDQSIEYYHLDLSAEKIGLILEDLETEKLRRDQEDVKDYETFAYNCVTVLIDHINEYSDIGIEKVSASLFDLDNHLFQFPIFVKDRLIESGLVKFVLFKSKTESRSLVL